MKVKCVICDRIESIEDDSPLAKKLRNRPIHTYMCENCHKRISDRTKARIATGKFKFYQSKIDEDDW